MAFKGLLCSSFSVLVIKQSNFGAGACVTVEENHEGCSVGAHTKVNK